MCPADDPLYPPTTVVVVSWNGRDLIERCLASVFAARYPNLEVVVVDNASSDSTARLVEERFPAVELIRSSRNLGFAGACNLALQAARGQVLVLLNQDAIAEPDCFRHLVDALKDPRIGVAGSRNVYPDGRIQSAGGSVDWPLGIAQVRGQGEPDGPEWDTAREVEYVSGCGMAFRREVAEAVGFLDETFWPGYYEDVDFCLRSRKAGFHSWYTPSARLTHLEGSSFRKWSSIWRFHHRGRLHLALKHAPEKFLGRFLPTEKLFLPALTATVGGPTMSRAYCETVVRSLPPLQRLGVISSADAERFRTALCELARLASNATQRGLLPDRAATRSVRSASDALLLSQRYLIGCLRHQQRELSIRAAEQAASRATLEERARELRSARDAICARDEELGSVKRVLGEREAEITSVKDVLAAREAELASVKEVLEARGDELASVKEVLEARGDELASVKEVLEARGAELASVKEVLKGRGAELASVKDVLVARGAELVSVKDVLVAREAELVSVKDVLMAREAELGSVKEVLEARDAELASVKPILIERDRELASVKPALEARDHEVRKLRALVEDHQEELAALRIRVQAQDRELAEMKGTFLGRLAERWSRRRHRSSMRY